MACEENRCTFIYKSGRVIAVVFAAGNKKQAGQNTTAMHITLLEDILHGNIRPNGNPLAMLITILVDLTPGISTRVRTIRPLGHCISHRPAYGLSRMTVTEVESNMAKTSSPFLRFISLAALAVMVAVTN